MESYLDDKLFCPTGCTYMQINNNSRLKWPAGPAADGRNEACDCEDDKTVRCKILQTCEIIL